MKKTIMIALVLTAGALNLNIASAQTSTSLARYSYSAFNEVLDSVEANNAKLKAQRELMEAKSIDARTINNLDDPEVELEHMWAKSDNELELTVSQSFDFPSAYSARRVASGLMKEQARQEYLTARKEILVEAQSLCVSLTALKMQNGYLKSAYDDASRVLELTQRRLDAGDASILELNNAKFQYISANNDLVQNELAISNAQTSLDNLNGGKPLELSADCYEHFIELPSFEEILSYWEEAAPEVKYTDLQKQLAEQNVKVSRRESLPKFALGYKHANAGGGEKANGVVVGVSIPIFQSRGRVKLARAENVVAQSEYASMLVDLRAELKTKYDQATHLIRILTEYQQIIHADNAQDMLYKALTAGQISLVDYYSQLIPVHENFNTYIDFYKQYMTISTELLMVD